MQSANEHTGLRGSSSSWLNKAKSRLRQVLDAPRDLREVERLRALCAATHGILLSFDDHGQLRAACREWCLYTGQSEEASLGFGYRDMIHLEDRHLLSCWPEPSRTQARPPLHVQVRVWSAESRRYIDCLLRGAPLGPREAGQREWLGLLQLDVRSVRQEARLNEDGIAMPPRAFVRGLIHELSNALQGVVANTEVIAATVPHELNGEATKLGVCVDRLVGLCKKLMMTDGLAVISKRSCMSADLLDIVQYKARSTLQSRTQLQVSVLHNVPAEVDVAAVQTILMNVLINAEEAYTNGAAEVRITATASHYTVDELSGCLPRANVKEGPWCLLEITDRGCGMSRAVMERMYEPFFSTKLPSRGLGLSVVLGLLGPLGALIRVTSAEGRGTSVQLYFPISDASHFVSSGYEA